MKVKEILVSNFQNSSFFSLKMIPQYCNDCASLLRTISESLAPANERVYVHNERNFPQAKLDSEINVRFLLNEHGDLIFLMLNNSVHIIFFNLKKKLKNFIGRKKKRYR